MSNPGPATCRTLDRRPQRRSRRGRHERAEAARREDDRFGVAGRARGEHHVGRVVGVNFRLSRNRCRTQRRRPLRRATAGSRRPAVVTPVRAPHASSISWIRAAGCSGSIITGAAPVRAIAHTAVTESSERGTAQATRTPGPAPRATSSRRVTPRARRVGDRSRCGRCSHRHAVGVFGGTGRQDLPQHGDGSSAPDAAPRPRRSVAVVGPRHRSAGRDPR